ncbi:MAG: enamine deaminase RidA (YjgF/YER057c/UK114 family) [Cyclobacteriaceae bacterium]|jgi:enamine deaminase RidA (YjgF/YER057c/UK114 family)
MSNNNIERKNISSGSPWEDIVGYSRAVKMGNVIEVSGTAPLKDGQTLEGSLYEQTKLCLEIIQTALAKAGATLEDVVRTRIFVTDISKWEEAGKAHGEFFGKIKPATTMVEVSRLIDDKMMVEIEATAILRD